jgi:uncharacterized protein YjgD (DUF1641 family)
MWEDFKTDATPMVHGLYAAAVEQLAEIEPDVGLEDLLRLTKRLARNAANIERMLDQLESLSDFVADAGPLTEEMFHTAVLQLEELEQRGYFGFAREGQQLVDNVVTSFSEDDVRQLGDNIVLILNTVKAMTQPEIMNLVNNITVTYRQVDERQEALPSSTLDLVRQMRDPEVRRGLALTMRMLKTVAQEAPPPGGGTQAVPPGEAAGTPD